MSAGDTEASGRKKRKSIGRSDATQRAVRSRGQPTGPLQRFRTLLARDLDLGARAGRLRDVDAELAIIASARESALAGLRSALTSSERPRPPGAPPLLLRLDDVIRPVVNHLAEQ